MKPGNKLKIKSLPKGWCDNDEIMLHACFQLLTDCTENENLLSNKIFDWKHSEEVRKEKEELKFLYKWWKKRLKNDLIVNALSELQYKEDSDMLIRLIKIRNRLWT